MQFKTADLLVAAILSGDATSSHSFDLARLLTNQGVAVCIHSNSGIGPLPPDIRALTKETHPGDYLPTSHITILQYPIWFPLAERFREASGAAVFWYHGVTPPSFWGTDTERDILARAEAGTQLAWYAHLAVADSPFIAQELHRHSGYPLERIRIVPLGLDTTAFRQKPSAIVLNTLRRRLKLVGKRVLLYTGRVAGNKRIELLIEALARLKDAYPDLHLLVVGDTEATAAYRETAAKLRAHVQRLGLGSCVTFTGRVASIEPYYHLAEVYLSASQHEGFGLPLIEAMAAGVPVIASASGAMPWVLNADTSDAEAAGLLFPAGDAGALVQQVRRILDEPGLRQVLIERGYRRIEYFSRERFNLRAAKVLSEAEALAQQGPPPAAYRPTNRLYDQADISLRNYRVRSRVPILGPLIEWIRYNSTTHVKEAYLDRIIERQVLYNRLLADEICRLQAQVTQLKERVGCDESDGMTEDGSDSNESENQGAQ